MGYATALVFALITPEMLALFTQSVLSLVSVPALHSTEYLKEFELAAVSDSALTID